MVKLGVFLVAEKLAGKRIKLLSSSYSCETSKLKYQLKLLLC
jgi:hypothetical protein